MIPRWKMHVKTLGGVATNGDKDYDKPPMNPRGGLSPMNPEAYIGLPMPI